MLKTAVLALSAGFSFLVAPAAFSASFADRISYVTFASTSGEREITVAARFVRPGDPGGNPLPAVVILHGSGGPSAREDGYAAAFAQAGIASLTIDEWAPRGFMNGGRPSSVQETLSDVYAARRWLSKQPDVDGKHIGVIGFSFGGVAAMLTATQAHQTQYGAGDAFQAIMPVYPVCWIYNRVPGYEFRNLTGAPVKILFGTADEYDDDPQTCPSLVQSLGPEDRANVQLVPFPNAHHGFDKPGENRKAPDAYGHRGKGGLVQMQFDPHSMRAAHAEAVEFFVHTLADPK